MLYGKKRSNEVKLRCRVNQPTLKSILRLDMNGKVIDKWEGIKYMCRMLKEYKLNDAAVIRVAKGRQEYHKGFKFKIILSIQI